MIADQIVIKERHYEEAETFLHAISYEGELYETLGKEFIFRGQATDEFTLLSSALRDLLSLQNIDLTKETDKKKQLATFAFAETETVQISNSGT